VLIPELLSGLAEYRLLFVGVLLLVVLWLAPEGVIGTIARSSPPRRSGGRRLATRAFRNSSRSRMRRRCSVSGVGISFGGIKAASDVSFMAPPGRITSVIGPNGAARRPS
jgi:hypothetical protein